MENNQYHIPVLLNESVDHLLVGDSGVYVDVTFGGGGHSREVLSRLSAGGVLVAFDQDEDAKSNVLEDERFHFVDQNFQFVKQNLRLLGYRQVDALLADLGVSSHQFDTGERGFSIRFDGRLDMRMNQSASLDAWTVVNEYGEEDLARIFKLYGELKNAKQVANRVVYRRADQSIDTAEDLKSCLKSLATNGKHNQFFAKVFQAVRIEVNSEMKVLEDLLLQLPDLIKPGGRIVFITYHSLEDRMVKNFVKSGNIEGVLDKDFFGNLNRPFKEVNRKPILPSDEELERNSRARSAKLRVAERI